MPNLLDIVIRDTDGTDQVVKVNDQDPLLAGVTLRPDGDVFRMCDSTRGQNLLDTLLGKHQIFEFNVDSSTQQVRLRPGDELLRGAPLQEVTRITDATRSNAVLKAVLQRAELSRGEKKAE